MIKTIDHLIEVPKQSPEVFKRWPRTNRMIWERNLTRSFTLFRRFVDAGRNVVWFCSPWCLLINWPELCQHPHFSSGFQLSFDFSGTAYSTIAFSHLIHSPDMLQVGVKYLNVLTPGWKWSKMSFYRMHPVILGVIIVLIISLYSC